MPCTSFNHSCENLLVYQDNLNLSFIQYKWQEKLDVDHSSTKAKWECRWPKVKEWDLHNLPFLLSVGHRPNGRKFFMTPKNFEQVQIQWQQTSESPRVSESALESQDNWEQVLHSNNSLCILVLPRFYKLMYRMILNWVV